MLTRAAIRFAAVLASLHQALRVMSNRILHEQNSHRPNSNQEFKTRQVRLSDLTAIVPSSEVGTSPTPTTIPNRGLGRDHGPLSLVNASPAARVL